MTRVCVSRENRVKKSGFLPLTLALASLSAVAAETVPTIIISASRTEQPGIVTPASITVISRQEIEEHGHRNVTELLRGRGGIQIRDLYGDGSSATIDMRGFGATAVSNTLVLVDGRRLNNASDIGALELANIDLENIERIEIVQGSAGTLYGNQAVGGVVNIITRRPRDFRAIVQTEAGDYDGYRLKVNIADRLPNGLGYRFSARKRENDNYRDNNKVDLEDTGLRLDYGLPGGGVFFELYNSDEKIENPGSLFADELRADREQSIPVYAGDYSDTRTTTGRLGLRHDLVAGWRFEGELTYRENNREFKNSFRSMAGSRSTQDRHVWGFNPRLIGRIPTPAGDALVTLGMDFEETDYKLLTSFGPQINDQDIQAAYLQAVIPLSVHWSATLGFRHAWVDNDIDTGAAPISLDDQVNVGALGFIFRPNSRWRLFARADQNYRFAAVDEHTNVVFGQPVGLENQTGVSYEIGAELSGANHRGKLLLYRLDLDDEISFDSSGFSNINLDETRRKGVILEGEWAPSGRWTLGGSYSYTNARITSGPNNGNRIPLVSRHSARLFTDVMLGPHWFLFAELQVASDKVFGSDFSNSFPRLAGYGVTNAALRYQRGAWFFSARVNNLLDKEYATSGSVGYDAGFTLREAYFPAPERNFWLTARYRFD